MTTPQSPLYLKFGVGVVTGTVFWNAVAAAQDILDGEDLSFTEELLTTTITVAQSSPN